jgi:DNA mismatch endonuclease (patch repair protein)
MNDVAVQPDRIMAQRSALMRRVRRIDTKPEMVVRRRLHALGYRFRLHDKRLPSSPDIVLPGMRAIILVHGCFWHRHHGCRLATTPKSRVAFWSAKFAANEARDARDQATLRAAGWTVHVVWECETRNDSWLPPAIALLQQGPRLQGGASRLKSSRAWHKVIAT